MSFDQVQRVAVRMYFDPNFTERVYADPIEALGGVDLTDAERSWLTALDKRRWMADTLRPARALHAVIAEFPVSVASACADGRLTPLSDFFESEEFHESVMQDESLALTFGAWLSGVYPNSAPLCALEGTIAAGRRNHLTADLQSTDRSVFHTSPHARALIVPSGTLQNYLSALHGVDFVENDPVECVLRMAGTIPTERSDEREGLLIECIGGASISEVSIDLVLLLERLRDGMSRTALIEHLQQHGSESDEAAEIIEELVLDGLVIDPGQHHKDLP